ncbi:MAG: histidine kinase dimerization/phospho-acceptor domain-containing protein [Pseudomonadota bacterium]
MAATKSSDTFTPFTTLSSVINVPVLLLDATATLVHANVQACKLLGAENEEILQTRWDKLQPLFVSYLEKEKIFPHPNSRQFVLNIPQEKTSRSLYIAVHPIDKEPCNGYLILLRDQSTLSAVENMLLLGGQMQSIAYLYSALAHDLKAPLNAMQITIELMSASAQSEVPRVPTEKELEAQRRYVRVLREELARLNRIVDVTLTQTLPSNITYAYFDLGDPMREMVAVLTPQARRQQIDLQVQLTESPVTMTGQSAPLKQALINIALYSLRSMKKGGELAIQVSVKNRIATIVFENNSVAMSQQLLDGIYQMYPAHQENDEAINLQVARLAIETYHGEMFVDSANDIGSRVVITLPMSNVNS